MEAGALCGELDQHRDGAVGLRRGSAKKRSATSRCTITHQRSTLGRPSRLSTTIGVATLYGRFATSFAASARARRGRAGARRRSGAGRCRGRRAPREVRLERAVELDGVDVGDALGEEARQHAEARPDLEHDVGGVELGEPADHAEDVLVDQEVLAELLLGGRGGSRQAEAGAAFASIWAASAAGSSPRASASAATVWTTFAGSFGRPRRGCGARYGRRSRRGAARPGRRARPRAAPGPSGR